MSINKELARRWVAALRSGDYQQCRGRLGVRDEAGAESFCCLGVLCEVAVVDGQAVRDDVPSFSGQHRVTYEGSVLLPPYSVQTYLEVDHFRIVMSADEVDLVGVPLDDEKGMVEVSLDALNDEAGWTFEQIADAIERSYELVEVTV